MPTPIRRRRLAAAVATVSALALGACGGLTDSTTGGDDTEVSKVKLIVPADAGGGWDQTAREMQRVLQDTDLVSSAQVENVPGAGGTVGLSKLANEKDPDTLMVMGLVMLGAVETNESPVTLSDTTPIARLTEEAEVIVVPKDSPYKTIDDLVKDLVENGKDVSIAGGSAGGIDNILAGLLLKASGVEGGDIPDKLNYIPYSGGGESLAALLGNKVSAGISGVGEYLPPVKSGKLRALAVSGAERVEALPDVPTLEESGLDLVVTNWRGVVAPGNVSDAKADALTQLLEDMHGTDEWQEVLTTNDWGDAFQARPDFESYIESEQTTVRSTLRDIGLVK